MQKLIILTNKFYVNALMASINYFISIASTFTLFYIMSLLCIVQSEFYIFFFEQTLNTDKMSKHRITKNMLLNSFSIIIMVDKLL